jgi:hypothetical protein
MKAGREKSADWRATGVSCARKRCLYSASARSAAASVRTHLHSQTHCHEEHTWKPRTITSECVNVLCIIRQQCLLGRHRRLHSAAEHTHRSTPELDAEIARRQLWLQPQQLLHQVHGLRICLRWEMTPLSQPPSLNQHGRVSRRRSHNAGQALQCTLAVAPLSLTTACRSTGHDSLHGRT